MRKSAAAQGGREPLRADPAETADRAPPPILALEELAPSPASSQSLPDVEDLAGPACSGSSGELLCSGSHESKAACLRTVTARSPQMHASVSTTELCLRKRRLSTESVAERLADAVTSGLQLAAVTSLDLSRNRLKGLPDDVGERMPALEHLNLSDNRFAAVPVAALRRIRGLRSLNLVHNQLVGPLDDALPAATPHLAIFRVGGNRLTALPASMALFWGNLAVLEAGGTLCGNHLAQIAPPGTLRCMTQLVELDVSNNCLVELQDDWPPHLRSLNLYANRLVELPPSIQHCRGLRSLVVARNRLTSLPAELVDLVELEHLDCSGNRLCVLPDEIIRFMRRTSLLITGNPMTQDRVGDFSGAVAPTSLRERAPAEIEFEGPPGLVPAVLPLKRQSPSWATVVACRDQRTTASGKELGVKAAGPRPQCAPPSLLELCARNLALQQAAVDLALLPRHLAEYLQGGGRSCAHCGMPYVREWVSDIIVRQFLGTPNVRHRVRYCTWSCWSAALAAGASQSCRLGPEPADVGRLCAAAADSAAILRHRAASNPGSSAPHVETLRSRAASLKLAPTLQRNLSESSLLEVEAATTGVKSPSGACPMRRRWQVCRRTISTEAAHEPDPSCSLCVCAQPPNVRGNGLSAGAAPETSPGSASPPAILSPLVDFSRRSSNPCARWAYEGASCSTPASSASFQSLQDSLL